HLAPRLSFVVFFCSMPPPPPRFTPFPYTTLFRSPRGTSHATARPATTPPPSIPPSSTTGSAPRGSSATSGASSTPCSTSSTRARSEEHTSELQSRVDLVCRLLLEKKKKRNTILH